MESVAGWATEQRRTDCLSPFCSYPFGRCVKWERGGHLLLGGTKGHQKGGDPIEQRDGYLSLVPLSVADREGEVHAGSSKHTWIYINVGGLT